MQDDNVIEIRRDGATRVETTPRTFMNVKEGPDERGGLPRRGL